MDVGSKKQFAVEFIRRMRVMDPELLTRLIAREAGEDLSQFFMSYCKHLIETDLSRAVENTASAMLMGYLIRSYEDKQVYRFPVAADTMPTA